MNAIIAILLIAFAIAVYWYAWRPLFGETSGDITVGVSGPATISRDGSGFAYRAANLEDALFLEGYAMAQDRLWQIGWIPPVCGGRMWQIAGPAAVEADRESRRFRMRRVAEEQERRLSPDDRLSIAAFARGVNEYIESHRTRLPLEFTLCVGILARGLSRQTNSAGSTYRELTPGWRAEMNKLRALEGGHPRKSNFYFPRPHQLRRSPARTRGRFQEHTVQRVSPCLRMIRIWNFRSPRPGIRCIYGAA